MKHDIKSKLPSEILEYFASIGEQKYRAGQLFRWLRGGAESFAEMTNLSESLRAKLDERFIITKPELIEKQVSAADGTIKYLWRMADGHAIESVLMEYSHGNTVCISTQAGCRMGCVFCASAIGGLKRDLTASEMENQVFYSQFDSGKKISNIVLMGIGEPLDNFDNVIRFLTIIRHPDGMNIGARHITLSTCGLTDKIKKLAEQDIQLTLSISLHAPDDDTRAQLMPIARSVSVDDLLKTCAEYYHAAKRRVSYEYAMIDGVNDTPAQAKLLAGKLKNTGSHVNLILLNDVPEYGFRPSSPQSLDAFSKTLSQYGINYTIRRRLGADIDASCGQLRQKHMNSKS